MKHLRRILPIALLIPFLLSAAFQATTVAQQKPTPQKQEDPIVYVTKTGTKYHTATCRYLSKSKIPMKLSAVPAKITACSVCKPPARPKK
jgi:hypothetical protein